MPPSGTATLDVDAVELVTALLRGDPGALCVLDRRTGEIHRSVGECDPEEEPRPYVEDPARYVPIRAWSPEESAAFWGRASPSEPRQAVTGLYRALAAAPPDARARLLEAAQSEATRWLAAHGIDAVARVRV